MTFCRIPKFNHGYREQGAVGKAQMSSLQCKFGDGPALTMVPSGKASGEFIGFCAAHKAEGEDFSRKRNSIARAKSEANKDRQYEWRNMGRRPDMAKQKAVGDSEKARRQR